MFTLPRPLFSKPGLSKIVAPALIAALGLGMAVPAQAQDWRHNDRNHQVSSHRTGIGSDIASLDRDINRAAARRAISAREATSLRRQATRLQRDYARFARNGLTRQETRSLQSGVTQIRHALRAERRDGDRRRG